MKYPSLVPRNLILTYENANSMQAIQKKQSYRYPIDQPTDTKHIKTARHIRTSDLISVVSNVLCNLRLWGCLMCQFFQTFTSWYALCLLAIYLSCQSSRERNGILFAPTRTQRSIVGTFRYTSTVLTLLVDIVTRTITCSCRAFSQCSTPSLF